MRPKFPNPNPHISLMAMPQRIRVNDLIGENLDPFDLSDAFFSSAYFEDGTPLSSEQLDTLTDTQVGQHHLNRLACESC